MIDRTMAVGPFQDHQEAEGCLFTLQQLGDSLSTTLSVMLKDHEILLAFMTKDKYFITFDESDRQWNLSMSACDRQTVSPEDFFTQLLAEMTHNIEYSNANGCDEPQHVEDDRADKRYVGKDILTALLDNKRLDDGAGGYFWMDETGIVRQFRNGESVMAQPDKTQMQRGMKEYQEQKIEFSADELRELLMDFHFLLRAYQPGLEDVAITKVLRNAGFYIKDEE